MHAYIQILKTTLKEYAAYRLNFVLWRVRMFLNLLFSFFLWSSVFENQHTFGSLHKNVALSYILYASVLSTFVLSSRAAEIGYQINDGAIINILLKPVSFFTYYLSRDIADKVLNVLFALCELVLVVWIFKAPLVIPHHPFFFVLFFINGVFISFFINLMLSFIGFWTPEIWAPRFLFMMIVFFVSGSYFPLHLLPSPLYQALCLTPFPYLFYFPTQMLVGTFEPNSIQYLALSYMWVFVLYKIATSMWKAGNKQFSFWGR